MHHHTAIYTKILNISNTISTLGKGINKSNIDALVKEEDALNNSTLNTGLSLVQKKDGSEVSSPKKNPKSPKNKKKNELKALAVTEKQVILTEKQNEKKELEQKEKNSKEIFAKWVELQDAVNHLIDSSKTSKQADKESAGIRQLLEKKEGIFRMKMMGKRVNYAGRSVISPDPFIRADEVGIPLVIATNITYPEIVTDFNKEQLKVLIINGAYKWPGR